ncbi:MAG TPA: hypothetical protein PLW44_08545, partial [Chitinophagales bacterium]|nr:hypothetical protein [Chitinophagales bacterium]
MERWPRFNYVPFTSTYIPFRRNRHSILSTLGSKKGINTLLVPVLVYVIQYCLCYQSVHYISIGKPPYQKP